jgi:unsaturated rhamnogalacturonyl hydrolase
MKKTFIINVILLLSLSMQTWGNGYGKDVVLLDNYYNHEINNKTNKPFHYIWEDKEITGYSELGDLFKKEGCTTATLKVRPEYSNLRKANIYIIVDPDDQNETPHPHYMSQTAANQIAKWVKRGGVLLVMANAVNNCDLDSINILVNKFGFQLNKVNLHQEAHPVNGKRDFNSCAFVKLPNHPIFKNVSKIFIKETCSITTSMKAKPVLKEDENTYIAETQYGKGHVLIVSDPWLYNEYIGNKLLPADFDNYKAAQNLVKYLIRKSQKSRYKLRAL